MFKYGLFLGFSFSLFCGISQPLNDDCSTPDRLCVDQPLQGTTTGATGDAVADYSFCPFPSATIWYVFTTNASGGNVSVVFSNLSFNPDVNFGQQISAIIILPGTPCDETTYIPRSNCVQNGADFTLTNSVALAPNTTYYVMVDGMMGSSNSAECDFDISISGSAVDANYPTASISAMNTVLCQGDEEPIETVVANCTDTASFDWYYNNTLISSESSGVFSTNQLTEDGYLKLIINCGSSCVYVDTTDSIFFEVTPISADAGPDQFIEEGEVVTLSGSGEGSPLWSPANSLTSATVFTPTANPSNTTTYFLTVTNGNCIETDSVNVFVGELVTIYSAFSPNEDLINDKWIIKNSAQYPNMEVVIYDRSGQKVFSTTGYSTQDKWWDGTYKGKKLPVSTYFYVVDLKIGDEGVFKGQVNIIR
ncbi:MAG: gliding motility-associated C-terminal domain-containing protein [Crocinitomicaceae bacterium]